MLDDKDRIFRNLYGLQTGASKCARRGRWDGNQGYYREGARLYYKRDESLRPAGLGGRVFSAG